MSAPIFLEADLFVAADLPDEAGIMDGGYWLRAMRRMLVLSWLLAGGVDGIDGETPCARAVEFWNARSHALHSFEPATLTTILFQLLALGPVFDFEETAGGFHVQLTEGPL